MSNGVKTEKDRRNFLYRWWVLWLGPLRRVPIPHTPQCNTFTSAGTNVSPRLSDYLRESVKSFIGKGFWLFICAFLFGVIFAALFVEGFFWYSFRTGGHIPFSPPAGLAPGEYFPVRHLPFVGLLPTTLYFISSEWFWFFIPLVMLVLLIFSIWDELKKPGKWKHPLAFFFEGLSPARGRANFVINLAILALIALEMYCIFDFFDRYRPVGANPTLAFVFALVCAFALPLVFTSFEVLPFMAARRIWRDKIKRRTVYDFNEIRQAP